MICMSMTKLLNNQFATEIVNLDEMIAENHFLRVIKKYFDWNFVYEEVEKLYSKVGRKSIDLVVLIKIHILKFLFNEDSLRKTYFRTKERVHRELTLLYVCMNLKKFALHHYA